MQVFPLHHSYDLRQCLSRKQRGTKHKKGVHTRGKIGTLKSLQKLRVFPARPSDFTPRVRREWKHKRVRHREGSHVVSLDPAAFVTLSFSARQLVGAAFVVERAPRLVGFWFFGRMFAASFLKFLQRFMKSLIFCATQLFRRFSGMVIFPLATQKTKHILHAQ